MDAATTLREVGGRHGGIVTRVQAIEAGIAHQRLPELAARGVIARVARGVYAVASTPGTAVDPRVITRSCNVVLSHASAAAWLGIDLPRPPDRLHVTAPRNRGRRRDAMRGVTFHRAHLGSGELQEFRGVLVTSPLRTALDIARSMSIEDAVAIVDSFLRARLIVTEEFAAAAACSRGPGRGRLQLVASLVDPGSGSILESLTRVLLWRNGSPAPTSQFAFIHPGRGLVGRVDFAWPQLRAILECDGYECHSSREQFQRDRRRWTAIGSAGWHLGVVTWFDVTCDPDYVVGVVRDLLAIERDPALLHTTAA